MISRRVRLRNNSLPGEKENASGLILDIKVFRVLDQLLSQSQNCDQLKGLSACLFRNCRAFAYKACVEILCNHPIFILPSSPLFLPSFPHTVSFFVHASDQGAPRTCSTGLALSLIQDLVINDIRHPCSCSCYT